MVNMNIYPSRKCMDYLKFQSLFYDEGNCFYNVDNRILNAELYEM